MRTFLDTNVFLNAVGRAHPEQEVCARILERVAAGSLEAVVNTETVQEILYVLTRRGRRKDGLELAWQIEVILPDMLPVTREDMSGALDLLERHPRLSVRDAVRAATILRNGLHTVVSVDPDFDQVPGIRRVAPGSA